MEQMDRKIVRRVIATGCAIGIALEISEPSDNSFVLRRHTAT